MCDKCQKPACKRVALEQVRRVVLQDEESQKTEGPCIAMTPLCMIELELLEPRRSSLAPSGMKERQGGSSRAKEGPHNRCCGW